MHKFAKNWCEFSRAMLTANRSNKKNISMTEYGFLSIVPPLLTIAVALYSKNVLIALIVGIASGSFIIVDFDPFKMMLNAIEEQVLAEFTAGTQSQVIITMMVIGGFVKLLEVSGGAKAFAQKMLTIVSTRARAQLLAWASGLGIFFTDSGWRSA